jgi:hypothetical protein
MEHRCRHNGTDVPSVPLGPEKTSIIGTVGHCGYGSAALHRLDAPCLLLFGDAPCLLLFGLLFGDAGCLLLFGDAGGVEGGDVA